MKVSGSSGCNTFTGSFTTEKDKLSFGNIASTRMSCPDMNIETSFLSSLAKSRTFSMYDGKLVLKDSIGTQLMSFDPLAK
jgi:heat shock protein HslJ